MDNLIVIVEDNLINAQLLMYQLNELGFKNHRHFTNANDALDWLHHNKCALILTDWRMFPVSGQEFLGRFRRMELGQTASIPVIIVTASAAPADCEDAIVCGANAYLRKPVSLGDLKGILEKWILVGS